MCQLVPYTSLYTLKPWKLRHPPSHGSWAHSYQSYQHTVTSIFELNPPPPPLYINGNPLGSAPLPYISSPKFKGLYAKDIGLTLVPVALIKSTKSPGVLIPIDNRKTVYHNAMISNRSQNCTNQLERKSLILWWRPGLDKGNMGNVMQDVFVYSLFEPWASYQIRKSAGCACAGNARKVFPAPTSKETAS